ncbi:MAG TPA: bestrophin family ion channel [Bryobacteraceae bacterium]|nr:bestrophin family ion channel [Bryobacteraceae bacterium]
MIVPHRLHVWKLVRYIVPALGILFAYDMLVVLLFYSGWTWISLPHIPLSLFGTAIGVILGFRNNTAYQRWWEARILWGAIVNSSRSLARQTLSMIVSSGSSPAEREAVAVMQQCIVQHQVAYVHALRCHLRGQNPWMDLQAFLPEGELDSLRNEKNVPLAIQQRIALLLRQCFERNWIDSMRWADLDKTLSALMNSQGGAERIKNTPLPVQYDHFPKIAVTVYCLVLPLGLVANLGIFTPIGSALVGLIFLALDRIGRDLELPFENEINDIPLLSISRTIEINLKQLLGDSELPESIQPVHGILW